MPRSSSHEMSAERKSGTAVLKHIVRGRAGMAPGQNQRARSIGLASSIRRARNRGTVHRACCSRLLIAACLGAASRANLSALGIHLQCTGGQAGVVTAGVVQLPHAGRAWWAQQAGSALALHAGTREYLLSPPAPAACWPSQWLPSARPSCLAAAGVLSSSRAGRGRAVCSSSRPLGSSCRRLQAGRSAGSQPNSRQLPDRSTHTHTHTYRPGAAPAPAAPCSARGSRPAERPPPCARHPWRHTGCGKIQLAPAPPAAPAVHAWVAGG